MAIDTSLAVQYLRPQTPQAKVSDEQTESITIKAREERTGKDAAVPVTQDAATPTPATAPSSAPAPAAGSQTIDVQA